MIIIDGIAYQLINVLFLLMSMAGPTQVIGTKGTTAAFLAPSHSVNAEARTR